MSSGDPEHFLELNDEFPVILIQFILEVLFKSINRVTRYNRSYLVAIIKVAAIRYLSITGYLHGDTTVSRLSHLHGFTIEFDRLNTTNTHIALIRDAERCSNLEDTSFDSNSDNNGVFNVEDGALDHF